MFKKLFDRRTTKADVIMALAGAAVAVWKAFDTYKDYKSEESK